MTVAGHSLVVVVDRASGVWPPIVTVTVPVIHVIVVTVIIIVMHVNTGAAIPIVIPVIAAMIRVAVVAVMMDVQTVSKPPHSKRSRYAPEETTVERVAVRIGVVVNRIGAWIIVIHGSRLVHDYLLRLIIGHVNYVLFNRRDFDDTVVLGNRLA